MRETEIVLERHSKLIHEKVSDSGQGGQAEASCSWANAATADTSTSGSREKDGNGSSAISRPVLPYIFGNHLKNQSLYNVRRITR